MDSGGVEGKRLPEVELVVHADKDHERAEGVIAAAADKMPVRMDSNKSDVNDFFVINVGGLRHEVLRETLQRHKGTKLANIESMASHRRRGSNEYFFDRDPGMFSAVLNYYRVGELHMPHDACGPAFRHELTFWGLDEEEIVECCWIRYCSDRATKESLLSFDRTFNSLEDHNSDANKPFQSYWERVRSKAWDFLDEPRSSHGSKVYLAVSFTFILLSISVFCLETYPGLNREMTTEDYAIYYGVNASVVEAEWQGHGGEETNNTSRFPVDEDLLVPNPVLVCIDYACMAFFSLEIIVRFIFYPKKARFFLHLLNLLDLLSIAPFYLELIVQSVSVQQTYKHNFLDALLLLKVLRVFRVFRLLRHYKGLQVLALTLKYSWRELLLLSVIMTVTMVIFSSLIYFTNKNDTFKSIPHSFWWAIVTMTTVGYGDMVPDTDGGYLIGAFCALSGVLVIGFTVPSIVSNFLMFYTHVIYQKRKTTKTPGSMTACNGTKETYTRRTGMINS